METENFGTWTYLVGGAPYDKFDLELMYEFSNTIIAVDGGANDLPQPLLPDYIVGDLDSVDLAKTSQFYSQIVHVQDEDTTDFEKAVLHCLGLKLPQPFVCLGFVGGRFDQTLTILHVCARYPNVQFVFIAGQDVIATLPLGAANFKFEEGDRVSLYPLTTTCEFGPSKGLRYPLSGLKMSQGVGIGTSNQATTQNVQIQLLVGSCFLIVEAKHQQAVLKALSVVD